MVHTGTTDPTTATLTVDPDIRGEPVEPMLFGKFCEHLGNNVYNGMEAQVLFNPTFGKWHFRAPQRRRWGGYASDVDMDQIRERARAHDRPLAYPATVDPDALVVAYDDGLAFGWFPTSKVVCSPDTGPNGDRAQRLEVRNADGGVHQRTKLPLHRTRRYEFRLRARDGRNNGQCRG
ncbi:hypothetical protein D3261_04660 [Halococcus sp. IIIV-5B]|nr:hypothetical protein D3261_04660 [Halococcus sp. IIIV-5B]